MPAVNFRSRLAVSEPPRTAVVLVSSDVFVQQKLASGSVHGCTLPDSLFQKAYGEYVLRYAVAENPQRIRTPKDGRGSMQ